MEKREDTKLLFDTTCLVIIAMLMYGFLAILFYRVTFDPKIALLIVLVVFGIETIANIIKVILDKIKGM